MDDIQLRELNKELSQKNSFAINLTLKDILIKIEEQEIRLNNMNTGMSAMSERMNVLENMVMTQKVKMTGSGPSVKVV